MGGVRIHVQRDPLVPSDSFRLLTYMLALWESERREQEERRVPVGDRRLSPMLPIVFYTGRRAWQRLGSLADLVNAPAELHGYLPRHDSVFFSVTGSDPTAIPLARLREPLLGALAGATPRRLSMAHLRARIPESGLLHRPPSGSVPPFHRPRFRRMSMNRIALSLAACLALTSLLAAEEPPKKDGGGAQPPAMQPPAVPAEMDQCANWVGEWSVDMTTPAGPMGPGGTDKGTYVCRKALKGMAIIGEYASKGSSGEFEGHMVYSFDPAEKKWHVYWIDSWSPGHLSTWVGESKDGTLVVETTESMGGQEMHCRITEHWASKDKVEWKMETEQNGQWSTMMSSIYTRTK